MSLYLGNTIGNKVLGLVTASPGANRVLDRFGQSARRMTGGRYIPGLTRETYLLFQQLPRNARVKVKEDGFYRCGVKIAGNNYISEILLRTGVTSFSASSDYCSAGLLSAAVSGRRDVLFQSNRHSVLSALYAISITINAATKGLVGGMLIHMLISPGNGHYRTSPFFSTLIDNPVTALIGENPIQSLGVLSLGAVYLEYLMPGMQLFIDTRFCSHINDKDVSEEISNKEIQDCLSPANPAERKLLMDQLLASDLLMSTIEEIFYRGFLFYELLISTGQNLLASIVVTTVLFSGAHQTKQRKSFVYRLHAWILAATYWASGYALAVPILLHFGMNAIAIRNITEFESN
jgi:hypothetical protein